MSVPYDPTRSLALENYDPRFPHQGIPNDARPRTAAPYQSEQGVSNLSTRDPATLQPLQYPFVPQYSRGVSVGDQEEAEQKTEQLLNMAAAKLSKQLVSNATFESIASDVTIMQRDLASLIRSSTDNNKVNERVDAGFESMRVRLGHLQHRFDIDVENIKRNHDNKMDDEIKKFDLRMQLVQAQVKRYEDDIAAYQNKEEDYREQVKKYEAKIASQQCKEEYHQLEMRVMYVAITVSAVVAALLGYLLRRV